MNAIAIYKNTLAIARQSTNTNSINGCNTSLGKDAIHRVSTNRPFAALFFQIGIILNSH